jgi:hypothetical protein
MTDVKKILKTFAPKNLVKEETMICFCACKTKLRSVLMSEIPKMRVNLRYSKNPHKRTTYFPPQAEVVVI